MKKKLLLILLAMFVMASQSALAIAIVPPVIYMASLSIASFAGNVLIFIIAYLAGKTFFLRKHFGKESYVIIRNIFSVMGYGFVMILSIVISFLLINPIDMLGMLIFSGTSGLICFAVLLLVDYRYILIARNHMKKVWPIFGFTLFVIVASFLSVSFATSIQVIQTEPSQMLIEDGSNSLFKDSFSDIGKYRSSADQSSEVSAKPAVHDAEDAAMGLAQEQIEPKADSLTISQVILFYPITSQDCRITIGEFSFSATPSQRCYIKDDDGRNLKTYCPVVLGKEIFSPGEYELVGSGSCSQKYHVVVTEEGFTVK